MKKILAILLITVFSYAESTFSDPQPTFDEPRKIVIQFYDSEINKINHNLSTIYNILKEYPSESLKVVVVAYGNGMRALRKDYDKDTMTRIISLMEYDVEFIGCRNTMDTMKWGDDEFIEDISFVQAGIVELIERQVAGYTGIIAY
ncbi:DsrE family protein [Arcobacter sp. LA11]|uniref:DsrE family protein n=1 Tax=Arcobacter sp. LA11 TaxID=1898176 RepID=UPI00093386ED|nr:DsrE family protein [Arcobacter sp. LA11]